MEIPQVENVTVVRCYRKTDSPDTSEVSEDTQSNCVCNSIESDMEQKSTTDSNLTAYPGGINPAFYPEETPQTEGNGRSPSIGDNNGTRRKNSLFQRQVINI